MQDDKTENPTYYRIKKVRKEGKTKNSRELNSFVILIVGLFSLCCYKKFIMFKMFKILSLSLQFNYLTLNNFSWMNIINSILIFDILSFFITIAYPVFAILIIAKCFNGIRCNLNLLKFNFNKLNIINNFKKIYSYHIIVELLKSILKLVLVMVISSCYLFTCFSHILALILIPLETAIRLGFHIIEMCFLLSIVSLVPIVIFDIYFQYFNYYQQFKMSRTEVKDELQQMEGNFYLKSRIRQTMKTFARNRMLSDVKKSDVIIVNPTSYAIALIYNDKTMIAPQVLAKGLDNLALMIREKANKHCIPIILFPFLARTLYFHTKVGENIPTVLYKLIAEVLAWVWKIKIWKQQGGEFPENPKELFLPLNLCSLKKDKKNE